MGVDRGYETTADGSEPGIDYVIAKRFIKNLNLCMRVSPDKPIVIHMKTCGGDWNEGMAIYDAIRSCPSPVIILNYTHARSMSSIILQAADKRVMMPHSYFMIHDGTYGIEGTYKGVMSNLEFDKRSEKVMLDIYAEKMAEKGKFQGQDVTKIKKWLRSEMDKKEDVFFTAEEAVAFGFADEIFNYNWSDLTKY
jgi:ATP-dependent protease ClpP protease subunit